MITMKELLDGQAKVAVIGLGYVGLPLAVGLGRKVQVLGFDISAARVEMLKRGEDPSRELSREILAGSRVDYTCDAARLAEAGVLIVAVPTPIDEAKNPDLTPVIKACGSLAGHLRRGAIVVFESTVYPGVTEDICGPEIERISGMKRGVDFKLGYSPERINPGDQVHTLEKVVKVVSAEDAEALEVVAGVYELVVTAGVFRAASIKVAEAAKVIENTQRDLNIALMNELAIIFGMMGIDTKEVLEAAGTKWNFLKFTPGLVGGHCIGVDPYYLTHKAKEIGYNAEVILAGRRINDSMGKVVAERTVKAMILGGGLVKGAKVLILGITFKENVSDIRNSRVIDIVKELESFGVEVLVHDPCAAAAEVRHEYGIDLVRLEDVKGIRAAILATGHDAYDRLSLSAIQALHADPAKAILMDVRRKYPKSEACTLGITYLGL